MNIIGIDLSLRSTGICVLSNSSLYFKLIQPNEQIKNEELLQTIWSELYSFIKQFDKPKINLEGLSLDSVSSSKDIIAGNFWYVRTQLSILNYSFQIVPVTEWRNPLFSKQDRKQHNADKKKLKEYKSSVKHLNRKELIEMNKLNKHLFLEADIKELTYRKLPDNVRLHIETITNDKSKYDLCDSYFISSFMKKEIEC